MSNWGPKCHDKAVNMNFLFQKSYDQYLQIPQFNERQVGLVFGQ